MIYELTSPDYPQVALHLPRLPAKEMCAACLTKVMNAEPVSCNCRLDPAPVSP